MLFPYFTFSNQEIDNLAPNMKNLNSILKAPPVNQKRQGCRQPERDAWPGFLLVLLPSLPPPPGRVGQGLGQHWKVTRLRRVLIPVLKVGMRQTSIRAIFKTNIGPSWQQGAHDGAPRLRCHDAAQKSLNHGHRGPDPPLYTTFFDSHSCPYLHSPN